MKKNIYTTLLLLASLLSQAQEITNNNFEFWTINGLYQTPLGWTSSNDFSIPIGPVSVSVDSSGYDGSLCAKIVTTMIGFAPQPFAGFIVNGKMNVTGHYDIDSIYKAGEPFTGRPDALIGYYRFSTEALIEDWGQAFVLLKKHNPVSGKTDTVGFGSNTFLNPTEEFREFRVPINYYLEDVEPDSIVVAFFSTYPSSPLLGGELLIDHLSLVYSSGIDNPEPIDEILVYPNPVFAILNIKGLEPKRLTVYNLSGQLMIYKESQNYLDISSLLPGNYILMLDTGKKIIQKRFIKNY
ncbi:T9SS type A sorting domain-containing protein [Bacteroidota bacterium]